MGGDAGFGDLVHLFGTDLDFVGLTIARHDRGMERLIHIRLRHGDIVFESPWDWLICLVDDTEDLVAVKLGLGDDTNGQDIKDIVDGMAF